MDSRIVVTMPLRGDAELVQEGARRVQVSDNIVLSIAIDRKYDFAVVLYLDRSLNSK